MSLVYSMILFGAGAILARILYVAIRRPRIPWWASETLVTGVLTPLAVTLIAFGFGLLFQAAMLWESEPAGLVQAAEAAGVIVVTLLVWKLLGRLLPPQTEAQVITLTPAGAGAPAGETHGRDPSVPQTPVTPPRRAA